MTKSSVNFKMVKSAWQAVSHSSREVAPSYLLDSAASMGTIVILDDAGKVASTLEAKLALASRQALREKNFSPVWEGVLNLPRPEAGFNPDKYKKTCADIVLNWCKSYEKSTGHTVLRADIHLDEGHMVDGEVVLNAHAHVIADRTNDKGRVMQLSPKMLRELQTLTAEVTGLERGESSKKTGRKHISHQAYKHLAEQGRLETQQQVGEVKSKLGKSQDEFTRLQKLSKEWSDADLAKIKDLQAKLDGEPARLAAALAAQKTQLDEQYRLDRAALKASGDATQRDYQQLKTTHATAVADLAKAQAKLTTFQADLEGEPERLAAALVAQKAHLDEQYRLEKEALETKYKAERVEYKASTEKKTQQDYKDLKAVHLGELDTLAKAHVSDLAALKTKLAEAKTEADKVPELVRQLNAAQEQTTTVTQQSVGLARQVAQYQRDGATATTAQADKVLELVEQVNALKPKADRVQGLEQDLAKAKTEADKVPALVAQVKTAQEQVQKTTEKLNVLTQKYEAFKEKAQGVVGEQNQKIAELIGELEEAKKPVLHQPPPQIPQSNLPTTASRPLEASKTAQEPPKRQEEPVPEKTPREVFLALWAGIKMVALSMIDGARLDAADGRLGLFSWHNRAGGGRNQALCEVPWNKVMPKIGEVFDSRAIPGKGKGGIGD